MPHHPVANASFSAVRRRVLSFSVLGLLLLVVLLSLFRPGGLVDEPTSPDVQTASDGAATTPSSAIGWRHAPQLVLAGLAAGLLTGMLGMGGGVVKILFMLLFLRLDIFFARAISLVTMFCSSASAVRHFVRSDLVMWRFVVPMLPMAVPAAVLAAVVGSDLSGPKLTHIFAIFVIFLAFNTLAFTLGDPHERVMTSVGQRRPRDNQGYLCAAIGGLHGAASGLLGISGGVIATPMQQLMLHVPLRRAIANTLLVSAVVTLIAGAIVLWTGVSRGSFSLSDVLFADLFMGTGAALGAPLGARLGERFNTTVLRLLFVVITLTAGLSILT